MNSGEYGPFIKTKRELEKEIEMIKSLLAQHLARIETLERKVNAEKTSPPTQERQTPKLRAPRRGRNE